MAPKKLSCLILTANPCLVQRRPQNGNVFTLCDKQIIKFFSPACPTPLHAWKHPTASPTMPAVSGWKNFLTSAPMFCIGVMDVSIYDGTAHASIYDDRAHAQDGRHVQDGKEDSCEIAGHT